MHDMTIEQDLLRSCACHKVRMAARAVTRAYDEALRPTGLRATQLSVLVAVGTGEAQSIAALAQVLGMDRSTLTRNLGPLEREGLVKVGLEGWRRSRTLEITKKGQSRLREALPLWKKAQDMLKGRLGNRDWSATHTSLDSLARVA
jgi:DNA-binding MarR family transcriptional regulator